MMGVSCGLVFSDYTTGHTHHCCGTRQYVNTVQQYKELYKNGCLFCVYVGNSISKLQIQVTTYVFELSAGNCHR